MAADPRLCLSVCAVVRACVWVAADPRLCLSVCAVVRACVWVAADPRLCLCVCAVVHACVWVAADSRLCLCVCVRSCVHACVWRPTLGEQHVGEPLSESHKGREALARRPQRRLHRGVDQVAPRRVAHLRRGIITAQRPAATAEPAVHSAPGACKRACAPLREHTHFPLPAHAGSGSRP